MSVLLEFDKSLELGFEDDTLPAGEVLDPLRLRSHLEKRAVGPGAVTLRAFAPVAVEAADAPAAE